MSKPHAAQPDAYIAFSNPHYRFFILSSALAIIGFQIQNTTLGYELYERTHDKLALAYLAGAEFLPMLVLGLFAGQLADWYNRRRLIQISQIGSALCSLGLAAISHYEGAFQWIYLCALIRGACSALGGPARSALLPQILDTRKLPNGIMWNSSIIQGGLLVGPLIGGCILPFSYVAAYLSDTACLLVAAMAINSIQVSAVPARIKSFSFDGLLAGFVFIWRTKTLLAVLSLDLFAVLLGGAVYLLPVFATDILHVGKMQFTWLRAAPALGSIMMAAVLAHLPPMKRAGHAMLWGVTGFGVATYVFGISTSFWLSLAMLWLTGVFDTISVVVRHTLVQLLCPDHMRGRVSAANGMFIGASNELGGVESGVTAHLFGPVASVIMGGIGTILVVLAVRLKWPQVATLGALADVKVETSLEENEPAVLKSAP